MVKLSLRTAAGIEGDGGDTIIGSELGTSLEEGADVFGKDSKEVATPPKFDFMENFLDRVFISKKNPPVVPKAERKPDSLFGGVELEFFKVFPTRKTQTPFFQFKEPVTGGTEAGVKESQEGLPISRKQVSSFHKRLTILESKVRVKKKGQIPWGHLALESDTTWRLVT